MRAKKKVKKAVAKKTKKAKTRGGKVRRKIKVAAKGYLTAGPHGPGDGEDD